MKRIIILTVLTLIITSNGYSQNSEVEFGLKAGVNYSKFTSDFELNGIKHIKYQRKPGLYVGGFLKVEFSGDIQFQPELLFAVQGTGVLIEDIEVVDNNGERTVSDYKSNINECTIAVPLVFRYSVTEFFFLEGGPQFGYIVDRTEKIKEDPFEYEGYERQTSEYDYDRFDMGLALGTGYHLTEDLILNGRFFFGLIDRDNSLRSSVINLGLEYNL